MICLPNSNIRATDSPKIKNKQVHNLISITDYIHNNVLISKM